MFLDCVEDDLQVKKLNYINNLKHTELLNKAPKTQDNSNTDSSVSDNTE